jgi:hypothetical protein
MVKVNMIFESEKVHSYKYKGVYPQPDKSEPAISSLYISKSAFDGKAPKEITIQVEEVR